VDSPEDLETALAHRVIGQEEAVAAITPYIRLYESGIAPEGRPAGVFLLLGPSGTGKTRTVEALADVLHGNPRNVLRVDCGEYQMEHEVAKLIGAPPGYLGHRETQPVLTQAKLNGVTSERSSLSLLLLDEIEKAAPSMTRLLLGVLDRAVLRLGDNNIVNFERSMIFLTSNLGAREMVKALRPGFGFDAAEPDTQQMDAKLRRIGNNAVRRRFTPEFVNRIDAVVTFRPLAEESMRKILNLHLDEFRRHIQQRLGPDAFNFEISDEASRFLLDRGISTEYGARELKRTLHRHLIQPLADRLAKDEIPPASIVEAHLKDSGDGLRFRLGRKKP
jgi:ATP-dependent Clp protease ATP-binding subunit ClpA